MSVDRWLVTLDRWRRIIPLRLRSLFRRRDVESELDEELQYHIEAQTAENIRRGMTPAAARAAALKALGDLELRKESVRDVRRTRTGGALPTTIVNGIADEYSAIAERPRAAAR